MESRVKRGELTPGRLCWPLLVSVVLATGWTGHASAFKAEVLPRRVFRVEMSTYFTMLNPAGISYGGLGSGANNADQLAGMVKLLSDMLYPGQPNNLGATNIKFDMRAYVLLPHVDYGLTDRITLAAVLPIFAHAATRIQRLEVDTGVLAFNSRYLEDPANNSPIILSGDAGALTGTEGALRLASEFFEYKPLRSWSARGVGDLHLAARMLLYSDPWLRLAAQAILTLPTGRTDDPDNLVDWGFGDGQTDLALYLLSDLVRIRDLVWNVELSYTIQFPDSERLRVYPSRQVPFAPKRRMPGIYNALGWETDVSRDLGDLVAVGSTAEVLLFDWFLLTGSYLFAYHFEDSYRINYPDSIDLDGMAAGTAFWAHMVQGGVGFDTAGLYLKRRFPVPFYGKLLASKKFSSEDTQETFIVILQLGVYLKW